MFNQEKKNFPPTDEKKETEEKKDTNKEMDSKEETGEQDPMKDRWYDED